jgi:hypothetical protein
MKKIDVVTLIGLNAISLQNGTKLYQKIFPILSKGESVELNFNGVQIFASPFFNSSIGLMLKDISIEEMKRTLKIVGMDENGISLLNHVISNAISFYGNKDNVKGVLDEKNEG